jgi:hypothetical protein
METNVVFDAFYKELQTSFFPDLPDSTEDVDTTVKHIEQTYYPSLLKIVQRDDTFFTENALTFRGIEISKLWVENETSRETIWKHVFMCVLASFFHGDIKEKIGTVIGAVKGIWNSSGQENDEITRLLNDEESEGHFKEIIDYLQNTRLAKIFMKLVEEIDITEIDLNFENPQELVDILRNPEHPKMKRVIEKIQGMIQQKMQRGEFTQQQIVAEIEGIKAKVQSLFGNVFNDMLGGRRADVPAHVLMGNSPEARRQRMLARLQKKQRDKNSH